MKMLSTFLLAGLLLGTGLTARALTGVGSYDPGNATALEVATVGQFAYVAAGSNGLLIVDVSNPSNPALVGQSNPGSTLEALVVVGNYAYAVAAGAGIEVFNITNPASPSRVGFRYDESHAAGGIAVAGNYAYVAAGTAGLVVYNISNPASPTRAGAVNDGAEITDVTVSGQYAYAAAGASGLRIYSLASPASPALAGQIDDITGSAKGVFALGNRAYLAAGAQGLRIYDVSTPASPAFLGQVNEGGSAEAVLVSGRYAYLANGSDGLRVYEISNAANPLPVAHRDDVVEAQGESAVSVAFSGPHAVLASQSGGLRVYATDLIEPLLSSWFTPNSGRYARVYETTSDKAANNAVTTWPRAGLSFSGGGLTLPAYSDIQEVMVSDAGVYVRLTGLPSYVMGPWLTPQGGVFSSWPTDAGRVYRLPRLPQPAASKPSTDGGYVGIWVNGVAIFNFNDAKYYNPAQGQDVDGTQLTQGLWHRNAPIAEAFNFDPANAHQPDSGIYHNHMNPIALRYQLGDHVSYDANARTYSETTGAPTQHSPILGWANDGYPIYGPYGYASAQDSGSGIRRMVSGYVLRNGSSGTANLTATGRHSLPQWAADFHGRSAALSPTEYGPNVSGMKPLGTYAEDYDHLGDLGRTQGTDFDLDRYGGRVCVTPEFPHGTYAYFVALDQSNAATFPFVIGIQFYGAAAGGPVEAIEEPVSTHFRGGPKSPVRFNPPALNAATREITLTWSGAEGGTYKVEGITDVAATNWTTVADNLLPTLNTGQRTENTSAAMRFYRVVQTAMADFDAAAEKILVPGTEGNGGMGAGGIVNVTPTSATRGSTITLTITLDANANPPPPPQNAPVDRVLIGTIEASTRFHLSQTVVTSSITIPANAPTGAQTVTVVFPGPPENPTQTVAYSLPNGFTIQ